MSWFRSKPKFPESFGSYAPNGLFDLHSHVLWGLDDGASDIDESVDMLDKLKRLGFVKVASTPHFNNLEETPSCEQQQTLITSLESKRGHDRPDICVGAEIIFDDIFLNKEKDGVVPGICGRPIYLVEFGFLPNSVPLGAEDLSFRFHLKDKQLILAHPERIPDLQRDAGKVEALHRSGMLFQLDVMSLAGKYGRTARQTAVRMLESGVIDVAATDLHHARDIDTLEAAISALLDMDEKLFERLFSTTPSLIYEGRLNEIVQYA